jgi:chromosome segregation ATPase
MTLSQQLQNQANDQRNQQLDLREQALAEREALLDDTERIKQLEVLDKQIEVKQSICGGLAAKVAEIDKTYHAAVKRHEIEVTKLVTAEARQTHMISKLKGELDRAEDAVAAARQELQRINQDIAQAQKYLKVQEGQVNDAVADWNGQLTALHQEAEHLNDDKAAIAADIIRLKQQRDDDEATTDELRDKLNKLQSMYQVKVDAYRDELAARRQEIDDLQTMRTQWLKERDDSLATLQTQERSLEIREAAVRQKELDLSQREKVLQMKLNMLN